MDIQICSGILQPGNSPIEIVERKGIGHPDTLADTIAEAISIQYSRHCLKNYGVVLNHNIDKLSLGRGLSEVRPGLSRMLRPIHVDFNGRISKTFAGEPIPYKDIFEKSAQYILARTLPAIDLSKDLVFNHLTTDHSVSPTWFNPRNRDDIHGAVSPFTSDSAVCVASYPLTAIEQLILDLEKSLYGENWTPRFPDLGTDIKFLVYRKHNNVEIMVRLPFLGKHISSPTRYYERRLEMQSFLLSSARQLAGHELEVSLTVNSSDEHGKRSIYLLAIGSCLECGEEGVVGRGNSIQGLISIMRRRSMEAPFGKNPLYHSGKVYAHFTQHIASELGKTYGGAWTVVAILRNGDPLLVPHRIVIECDIDIEQCKIKKTVEKVLTTSDHLACLLFSDPIIPSTFLELPVN